MSAENSEESSNEESSLNDDEFLDAENLFEVGDDGYTSDSDDDSLDVPPPLRERLCLSNENLRSSSGRLWSTNAHSAAGRRSASNICREGRCRCQAGQ